MESIRQKGKDETWKNVANTDYYKQQQGMKPARKSNKNWTQKTK